MKRERAVSGRSSEIASSGEHVGSFKSRTRFPLSIGRDSFDDLRRAPLGAIRNQNAKSEIAGDQR